MTLSREQIAALRLLLAKATPGPWHAPGLCEVHDAAHREIASTTPEWDDDETTTWKDGEADGNAELIAEAINALPALLDIAEAVALGERGAADPADVIAGALGVSRGYAYGLMRDAVLPLAGEVAK